MNNNYFLGNCAAGFALLCSIGYFVFFSNREPVDDKSSILPQATKVEPNSSSSSVLPNLSPLLSSPTISGLSKSPSTNQPSSSGRSMPVNPPLPSPTSSPSPFVLPEWQKKLSSNNQPNTDQRGASASPSPSPAFYATIRDKISGGTVEYSNDNSKIAGKVQRVWDQNKTRRDESGIACQVKWNDDVTSRMLFLDGSRVRVWSFGNEYGGSWKWDGGTLYVKMDAGEIYRFR